MDERSFVLQGGYKIPQELASGSTFFGSHSRRFCSIGVLFGGHGIDNIAILKPQQLARCLGEGKGDVVLKSCDQT